MTDWYTDDVRKALEIVPVELTQGYARFRLRPEKTWWVFESWGAKNQRWYIAGHPTDYEVQALIEKALREWLEERCDDGLWILSSAMGCDVWTMDGACEETLSSGKPTVLAALAAAVLAHAEDTP